MEIEKMQKLLIMEKYTHFSVYFLGNIECKYIKIGYYKWRLWFNFKDVWMILIGIKLKDSIA